jgi:hypothetical protein
MCNFDASNEIAHILGIRAMFIQEDIDVEPIVTVVSTGGAVVMYNCGCSLLRLRLPTSLSFVPKSYLLFA